MTLACGQSRKSYAEARGKPVAGRTQRCCAPRHDSSCGGYRVPCGKVLTLPQFDFCEMTRRIVGGNVFIERGGFRQKYFQQTRRKLIPLLVDEQVHSASVLATPSSAGIGNDTRDLVRQRPLAVEQWHDWSTHVSTISKLAVIMVMCGG